MGIIPFLWSRLPLIATYVLFNLLAIITVHLDLRLSQASIKLSSILYLMLLGCIGLTIFLIIDYYRWAGYLRNLATVRENDALDQLGVLPAARTYEQCVFTQAWSALYARLRAEVINEKHKGERNIKLVSQWAHHMKTPVSVIDLELQKASKQDWPQEIRAVLGSIGEENERLHNSLQTLLNMVRLEEFDADFRVESVDLGALVRRLVNDYKRTFIVHRVYPRVEIPEPDAPGSFTVQSDVKWLRFVLEQVLNNAIKYSSRPQTDGLVVFRCFGDGDDTVLEVADNGIGIASEDLGRVFQPFYTGANGRAYPQSTGMGLYLARETCLRLGHQIDVTAKPGEGTRVHVRFRGDRTIHADIQVD